MSGNFDWLYVFGSNAIDGRAPSRRQAGHQLAIPGLFRVMKYIWHEEPPLDDEKNTCNCSIWLVRYAYDIMPLWLAHTLSFRSHKNLSFCAFLCMKTPSRWPVSTPRISIALLPHPMIWPVPMKATEVGISPHWRTIFLLTLPNVLT